ncbi:MAG: response regulator [Planctomycetales bacterium]
MRPTKLLVVDDDQDFANTMTDILADEGYEVAMAFSGEAALEMMTAEDFDLSFMDLRLPGKSGVDSFLELRKSKPEARVVMMTGFRMDQVLEQAINNGLWAVLDKPLDWSQVLDLAQRAKPSGVILLDDDDQDDVREPLQSVLEGAGYAIAIARSRAEAFEATKQGGVDLLVLDVETPLTGGLDVYLELQSAGRALPTIIITGSREDRTRAVASLDAKGITGVVVQPFDSTSLLQTVDQLVE